MAFIGAKIREFKDTDCLKSEVEALIDEIGYIEELKLEGTDEAMARIENIDELINKVAIFELGNKDAGDIKLGNFLADVSLATDADNKDSENKNADKVTLMTLHSAKGLEFKIVFIVGMEEGLFPSRMCIYAMDESELEEERRLCYVAVTRAKKELYLSHVSERMVWGQMNYMIRPSRFISEMKQGNLDYLSEKNDKLSKKTGTTILFNQEPKRKIENFNPFSLKSVRTSELKNKEKSKYKVGDVVNHIKFGKGKIKKVDEKSLLIDFMTGEKKIALILAEKLLKG